MESLDKKYKKLTEFLESLDSLIVAFSGGIDSVLLLRVSHDVLGNGVLAVTADSPSIPRKELEECKIIASSIGARHLVIQTREVEISDYSRNPHNRCYFCKSELYSRLLRVAVDEKISLVADGTNMDDLGDYRPGLRAGLEYGVISPLKDALFTKQDVRDLAKRLSLEIWDKPSNPCLSSRIPYGSEVTREKLAMIEEAEDFLKNLGIRYLRVRHLGKKARIEVNKADFEVVEVNSLIITEKFEQLGFDEIDLREFRSGSLNRSLGLNP